MHSQTEKFGWTQHTQVTTTQEATHTIIEAYTQEEAHTINKRGQEHLLPAA